MKTITTAVFLAFFVIGTSQVQAQLPSIGDLFGHVDQAATQLSDTSDSILGFKKLQMPKLLDGLVDVRLKKPTIPGLGLLDKLKNFGQPAATNTSNSNPLLSGLGKLLQPPQNNGQGLLQKVLGGSQTATTTNSNPLFGNGGGLSNLLGGGGVQQLQGLQALQQQAGGVSQDVRSAATQLFSGQNLNNAVQPPLSAARQYSEQILNR